MMNSLTRIFLVMAAIIVALSGCSELDHEERYELLTQCPYGIHISFKYDYNADRADMFNDQVGSVKAYIFNDKGYLVAQQEESSKDSLTRKNYLMHIQGLDPGTYQIIALASQKDYNNELATSGAKYRRTDLAIGDSMSAIKVMLDRSNSSDSTGRYAISDIAPLDTLWHSMNTHTVQLKLGEPIFDTIPLMRDTKHIHITMMQYDPQKSDSIDIDNYNIRITDNNGIVLFDNSIPKDQNLVYTPYAKWNSFYNDEYTDKSGNVIPFVQKYANADIMCNRIITHGDIDNTEDAHLSIYNKKTGHLLFADEKSTTEYEMNLPLALMTARTEWETKAWGKQEYLDREYNYKFLIVLSGDVVYFERVGISILPWAVRKINDNF